MYSRQILTQIEKFLFTNDILLLYGARQVGKTSIMKIIQSKEKRQNLFFDLEQKKYLDLVNSDQELFIDYLKSQWRNIKDNIVVFIDEIQYADNPTSFLKYIHDHYSNIKFIVSWSSTLEIRFPRVFDLQMKRKFSKFSQKSSKIRYHKWWIILFIQGILHILMISSGSTHRQYWIQSYIFETDCKFLYWKRY